MKRTVVIVAALSMLAAGCGGDDTTTADDPVTSDIAGSTDAPQDDTGQDVVQGTFGCAIITDPETQSARVIGLQIIPQIDDQAVIDQIKTGTPTWDIDGLDTWLQALRPLGGTEYPPFGDPADAIEQYIDSNAKVRELVAIEGPVPQAKFDELKAIVGEPADFIMGQSAIGVAIEEACG